MSKPGSRSRRLTRSLAVGGAARAEPGRRDHCSATAAPKPAKLKAITAMPSKLSSLRRDAKGNVMTQSERNAQVTDSSTNPAGSSDYMGTPASKSLMEVDKVSAETNTTQDDGNSSTVASYGASSPRPSSR